jgi:hypothetical protein
MGGFGHEVEPPLALEVEVDIGIGRLSNMLPSLCSGL